jgi:transmembrane protein 33
MNYYGGMAQFCYRTTFIAAAVTYGIVVYKTWRARSKAAARGPQPAGAIGILADENVQYLGKLSENPPSENIGTWSMWSSLILTASITVMALVWLFAPQYPLAMLPYSVYSVFHVATYTRANLIPTIQPPKQISQPNASPNAKPQYAPNPIADKIGAFVKEYYDTSMSVVSGLEILLWIRLLLAAIFFQRRSWILIGIYTTFLRARFSQSTHVQGSFAQLEARVDSLVGAQGTPPAARQVWDGVKGGARQFHSATDVSKYLNGASAPKKTS